MVQSYYTIWENVMKKDQLKNFVEVADCGSINKAAEKLYISQPSLSRSIHALEEEMGRKLFIRSNRGITLTPTGNLLYYYARSILNQFRVLERLKKLENEENNEGNDSSYEEDDEDDENIDTENQYTNEDNNTKKSSQIRTALKANGITKKHLILIKQEKDVLFCSGTNTTKSVVSFLQKKKIQLKNIDEL